MYYILDENKNIVKVTLNEWENMFYDEARRVAFDVVNSYEISTMFLGIDHNFYGGEPVLFETMVFGCKDDPLKIDQDMQRYSTYEKALKGHQDMVNRIMRLSKKKGILND